MLIRREEKLHSGKYSTLTEVWHNNEPFILTEFKDVSIERNISAHCQNEFSRDQLAVMPFGIVISHKERWLY